MAYTSAPGNINQSHVWWGRPEDILVRRRVAMRPSALTRGCGAASQLHAAAQHRSHRKRHQCSCTRLCPCLCRFLRVWSCSRMGCPALTCRVRPALEGPAVVPHHRFGGTCGRAPPQHCCSSSCPLNCTSEVALFLLQAMRLLLSRQRRWWCRQRLTRTWQQARPCTNRRACRRACPRTLSQSCR